MIENIIKAIKSRLDGMTSYPFYLRKFCEEVPYQVGEGKYRVPAYFNVNEFRMIHDCDIQNGIIFFTVRDASNSTSEYITNGAATMNVPFRVVAMILRREATCEDTAQFELADTVAKEINGAMEVAGLGSMWVSVDSVSTDQNEILSRDLYGLLPWSSEMVYCAIDCTLQGRYINKCYINRTAC